MRMVQQHGSPDMNLEPNMTGVVLAGGKSSRMGQDKALLVHQGQTLLEKAQHMLRNAGCNHIVVSREEFLSDNTPHQGPMGGISTVLEHVAPAQILLVLPVDMPYLKSVDLRLLAQHLIKYPACPAVYFHQAPLPFAIRVPEHLNLSERSVKGFLKDIQAEKITHTSVRLESVNTPEEWQHFLEETT